MFGLNEIMHESLCADMMYGFISIFVDVFCDLSMILYVAMYEFNSVFVDVFCVLWMNLYVWL